MNTQFSYVLHAGFRHWKIVALTLLLGTAAGLLQSTSAGFQSRATLSITPSSSASSSPDRGVATEVGVLSSQEFASDVARRLGPAYNADQLQTAVLLTQRQGTDIIDVVVMTPSGPRSRLIAGAYLDVYLARLQRLATTARKNASDQYTGRITDVRAQLSKVDTEIAAVLAAYLPKGATAAALSNVPTIEQLRPDLASRRSVLLNEYDQLLTDQTNAALSAASTSASIVERATQPIAVGKRRLIVAAPFVLGGVLLGVFAAVAAARISPRVLDSEEIGEILGWPVIGTLPKLLERGKRGRRASKGVNADQFVAQLCTRIEAAGRQRDAVTVLVSDVDSKTRAPQLALNLVETFVGWGMSVAFADGNAQSNGAAAASPLPPETSDGGRSDVSDTGTQRRWEHAVVPSTRAEQGAPKAPYTALSMSSDQDLQTLHRVGAERVLSALGQDRDIVVVVAGPLGDSRTALQFAKQVDVIVVLCSVQRQTRQEVRSIAQQLKGIRAAVYPIDDASSKRSAGKRNQSSANR